MVNPQLGAEWIQTLLKFPFYTQRCTNHAKKYKTVYCATCNQDPVCVICWELISDQHPRDRHQVLPVRRSSERTAIEISKISEFLDVSEIQVYSINYQPIVFLNPNEEGASKPDFKPNCRTCQRKLIKYSNRNEYKFCSIACLVKTSDECCRPVSTSRRKRSRKGIPRRAPLF